MIEKRDTVAYLEKTLINLCLRGAFPRVIAAGIIPTDFASPPMRDIMTAIMRVFADGRPIDLPAIYPYLTLAESAPVLAECSEEGYMTADTENIVRIAKNVSRRRMSLRHIKAIYDEGIATDLTEDFDVATRIMTALSDATPESRSQSCAHGFVDQSISSLMADARSGGVKCIRTGIKKLDYHLGGGLKA
jgi:replicative DNA helicase